MLYKILYCSIENWWKNRIGLAVGLELSKSKAVMVATHDKLLTQKGKLMVGIRPNIFKLRIHLELVSYIGIYNANFQSLETERWNDV